MAILKQYRGWVSEMSNKDLAKIAPLESVQLISPKGCDCSTILANRIENRSGFDRVRLAEKWRRKGWSEAMIERSLADKERGKATTSYRGPSDSFELWEKILSALLSDCGSTGDVGLLVHEYSGSIDNQSMAPTRRRISASLSVMDALHSLMAGELILFDRAWLRAQAA